MRSNSGYDDHFNLFPFIAIMLCVLGVLLLVTLSMSAISMGLGSAEIWTQTIKKDGAPSKQPVLFEWDGKTPIVHRDNRRISISWTIPPRKEVQMESDPNAELKKEIQRIAEQCDTQYALIAVRPSGFANFDEFRREFDSKKVDIGFLPIGQDKPVKLQSVVSTLQSSK